MINVKTPKPNANERPIFPTKLVLLTRFIKKNPKPNTDKEKKINKK